MARRKDARGELDQLLRALKAAADAGHPESDEEVHCPECDRDYARAVLVRRSWSSPGIKRPGGGPNGSWREVWRCCPEGHKLIRVSFRIS